MKNQQTVLKQEPPTSPAPALKFIVISSTAQQEKLLIDSADTSPASTSKLKFSSPPEFVVSDSVSESDMKMEPDEEVTFEMPPTNHLDDELQTTAETETTSTTESLDTDAVEKGNELVRFGISVKFRLK